MKNYDPEAAPDPAEWLQLDEQIRIDLVERHHRATRIKLPNLTLHTLFHVIVENQIAEGLEPVLRAMKRLANEGLSRHDALHAVASVVTDHLYEAMHTKDAAFAKAAQARYNAAIEWLTVKEWRRKHEP